MKIPVQIPISLRQYCGEFSELAVEGDSIESALQSLAVQFPILYASICDETGTVRRHINFFVNLEWVPVHSEIGRKSPIEPGDVLTIWTAVSGG